MQLAPQKRTPCAQSAREVLQEGGEFFGAVEVKTQHTGTLRQASDASGIPSAEAFENALEHRQMGPSYLDTPGSLARPGEDDGCRKGHRHLADPAFGVGVGLPRGGRFALSKHGLDLPDGGRRSGEPLLPDMRGLRSQAFSMGERKATAKHSVQKPRGSRHFEETGHLGLVAAQQLADRIEGNIEVSKRPEKLKHGGKMIGFGTLKNRWIKRHISNQGWNVAIPSLKRLMDQVAVEKHPMGQGGGQQDGSGARPERRWNGDLKRRKAAQWQGANRRRAAFCWHVPTLQDGQQARHKRPNG